jgi:2-polyprenyl-3-methyl-5-hydroxy-6-metoxy-1,4-benzoquinol methylase
MTYNSQDLSQLRLLVAIACYGTGNLKYLRQVIANYKVMPMQVRVVVLSEAPKDVGPGAEVIVGLPSKDPWSLPFAHKKLFADNVDRYDLFAYSEDDMGVSETNIRAFMSATQELDPAEIAGFLRYELDSSGKVKFPDVHGAFHWKLDSVRKRGSLTVAEFTNEHAAFYLLTQGQLRRAIASGGFVREPCDGRHDLACEAATDPYTRCGFRKVVCISALDEFLIHHLSNRYADRVGLPLEDFQTQIKTLCDIESGSHPHTVLCEVETKFNRRRWSKIYYRIADRELMDVVPGEAKSILTVGCGWGAVEKKLIERGAKVTALPLDSVIGAMAARLGIEMVYGTLHEGLGALEGREFDCVVISDLLHLRQDLWEVLSKCASLVKPGGALVIQSHNFNYLPALVRRVLGLGEMWKLRRFPDGGVTPFSMSSAVRQLKRLGFKTSATRWFNRPHFSDQARPIRFGFLSFLERLMAEDWTLQARKVGGVTASHRKVQAGHRTLAEV